MNLPSFNNNSHSEYIVSIKRQKVFLLVCFLTCLQEEKNAEGRKNLREGEGHS